MKIKCGYCGGFIDDTEEICPHCGAVNEHVMRSADGVPKTIEELKAFCKLKKLPLEQMRFFIGVDYKQPKAFGIYKDRDGNFIVYKNKGNGTRVERYRGKDEAYAVNEIYQKLKSEIQIRREKNTAVRRNNTSQSSSGVHDKNRLLKARIMLAAGFLLLVLFFVFVAPMFDTPDDGYYIYNDDYYYCQNDTWYLYDDSAELWLVAEAVDSTLTDNYSYYYESSGYNDSYDISDFSGTSYYIDANTNSDYNDDWDGDDWDWGGGDWDIDDTDWDTDW